MTHHTTSHPHPHTKKTKKSINSTQITLLLLVCAAMFAGLFTVGVHGDSTLAVTDGAGASPNADLVAMLNQLHSIQLNTDLFSNPLFQSLQDFGLTVVPEPKTRNNPFAPIGVE